MNTSLLILCDTMPFWESVLASAFAAFIVLLLTFIFIHPWIEIFHKAVIAEKGCLRFQIRNKSIFNVYNVQIKAYIVEYENEEAIMNPCPLVLDNMPQLRGCFAGENYNTLLLDTKPNYPLELFNNTDFEVIVSATHSFSNIVQVKKYVFTKEDVYYGNIEHRKLIDTKGKHILIWSDIRKKIINWTILPLIIIVLLVLGVFVSNHYLNYIEEIDMALIWQCGLTLYVLLLFIGSIVNIVFVYKQKEETIRLENQNKNK